MPYDAFAADAAYMPLLLMPLRRLFRFAAMLPLRYYFHY